MRVKKYLTLTLAALFAATMLTGCPWDIEDDASSSPSSAPSSSSRPSHDSNDDNDDDSSSAPSSPSTPDEPEITIDANGALQLPQGTTTLSADDIEDIKGQIKTVVLEDVNVEQGTFANCEKLTTVTIKNGTLDSGDAVSINGPFKNCDELKTVTLDGVTINGAYTFWDCQSLKEVNLTGVKIGNNVYGTFNLCRALTTVNGANTLESIPQSMFSDCTSLRYIDVSKATSIGHSAFAGCTSLTAVDVNNATSIGQSAFLGCNSLKNIRVGTELTSIEGNSAFKAVALDGTLVPMELTVHCSGSKQDANAQLEDWFKDNDICGKTDGYPQFEYNCNDDCWNQIVNESQAGGPEAGNVLARYLLDLRL